MTSSASPLTPPTPPLWALRLGYAGLLPFVLSAALVWTVETGLVPYVILALVGYGAAIASFLGGIHWGLAMREGPEVGRSSYIWGVVPSLLASIAVVMPAYAGLVVLGALLIGCYVADRKLYPRYQMQGWLTLRLRLTAVASLSCFLGASGI